LKTGVSSTPTVVWGKKVESKGKTGTKGVSKEHSLFGVNASGEGGKEAVGRRGKNTKKPEKPRSPWGQKKG